jgi:hypothetical protein
MIIFLKNFASAISLAFGTRLTFFSIIKGLKGGSDSWVSSLFLGMAGIPLLFAFISSPIPD